MNLAMLAMWGLVGLLAGWLAGVVMKPGGYGLRWDIGLGVVGSIVGSWIFGAVGVAPQAAIFTLAAVAFVGAALFIVAQRKIWPAIA
jgi:uncharacterized membrane protein YeaQ/YmgE (transglycosylase-associated protein family)